jgi:uncharacterized protein (DUF433 family)
LVWRTDRYPKHYTGLRLVDFYVNLNMKNFELITANPEILGGKPIIKGTRISVDLILEWLATGSVEDILKNFPHLNRKAINEAILYASHSTKNEIVIEAEKKS